MQFGQTLAIAGLLSQETISEVKGIPYLMDVPYLGAAFRRTSSKVNETELLILVQPELVEALDCDQAPTCGPGMTSLSPNDCDLFWKAYREVPVRAQPGVNGGGMPPFAPENVPPSPSAPQTEELPPTGANAPGAARGG